MPKKVKKLANLNTLDLQAESEKIGIPMPCVAWRKPKCNTVHFIHREDDNSIFKNYIDVPHAFLVEWAEDSDQDKFVEPTTYSIYVLNETKAKEIVFDLMFGLRNSESWSVHVPHCDNRKVRNICIELVEIDKSLSTNSLYCEYLDEKAKDWFSLEDSRNE